MASFLELFGFKLGKNQQESQTNPRVETFAPPMNNDGAAIVSGGAYAVAMDLDGTAENEAALITKYRRMAQISEVESAIDDIINEAIVIEDDSNVVELNLDKLEYSDSVKDKITKEFERVLELLDFNNQAYDIFKRWYVDGRLYYHKMIDAQSPKKGLMELRYIDPRRIKKVREISTEPLNPQSSVVNSMTATLQRKFREYYVYNEQGITKAHDGIRIASEAITYVHSGILDENNKLVLSCLHKAIKPANQLKWMEDSLIVYRLSRAPERRIFYIDVGNLPKAKAEQYLNEMMVKHKNKLVYDAATGDIRDDRRHVSMLEDYWIPRREGGKGTEITTLPAGQNLGEIEDVLFFMKKLYKALNVPISRIESDSVFNIGRASEISRDELKFSKFINRLRSRFTMLFDDLLSTQLQLKGILSKEEWLKIKERVGYKFSVDNHFAELKNNEILRGRVEMMGMVEPLLGKFFSVAWARKNVLHMTEEECKKMDKEMQKEAEEAAEKQALMQQTPEEGQQQDGEDVAEQEPQSKHVIEIKPVKEELELIREEQTRLANSISNFFQTQQSDVDAEMTLAMSRFLSSVADDS